jgi:hypothetical protein
LVNTHLGTCQQVLFVTSRDEPGAPEPAVSSMASQNRPRDYLPQLPPGQPPPPPLANIKNGNIWVRLLLLVSF